MDTYIRLYELKPGKILAQDVQTDDGAILLRAGIQLSQPYINKLLFLGIEGVYVQGEQASSVMSQPITQEKQEQSNVKIKRVLIVDDLKVNRMLIASILSKSFPDLEIIEASDGLSATEMYPYVKPDLVFMDILMPVMDGIEAIKKIKRLNQQAIIIVCSTEGEGKMVLNAIKSGAKDFIVKPYYRDRVLQAVNTAFGVTTA